MTKMQKERRERRNTDIITGAAIIIAALNDYQAVYPTAKNANIRRYVYDLLDAIGIKMDDLKKRRHEVSQTIAELTCESGVRELRAERAKLARLRGRRDL